MTEFSEVTTYTLACPYCEGHRVIKMGVRNGQQRYRCKREGCGKAFRANGKAKGRRMDAELMGSAIRDFYTGKSYKQIAEGLKDEYDLEKEPSKATIYEWVRDYTDEATARMKDHKAKTGDHWVADEMVVDVGGKKAYNWNVMDEDTRYILSSHLSYRRDGHAARAAIRKAAEAADRPPKKITTDKWRAYIKPIKDILPEAEHVQSEGMTASVNNNLSERLQGTFRDRTKTFRGLDSIETGQRYLDGWTLTYNLFRGHESLRNKTPGDRAKVNPPFKEWADVVKAGAASRPAIKAVTRPASQTPSKSPRRPASPKEPARVKPAAASAPTVPGERRRRRSRIRTPKPVYPKVGRKSAKKHSPPPWAVIKPRLPGRN